MGGVLVWVGWFFSAVVSLVFVLGAYVQFNVDISTKAQSGVPELPDWTHPMLSACLLMAAILHLVPQPSFATMGAIIMTGMIGGMIGTLLMQGNDFWWVRVLIGVLPWLGLYLRSAEFNVMMSFWR